MRRKFTFEIDGEPAEAWNSVGEVNAQDDRLHAFDRQGFPDHGFGRFHQGEQRAVGARLEELRARVIVRQPLDVLLHPREVLQNATLLGQPDPRRIWDGHLLQQGRRLDLFQGGFCLRVKVSGELPQLVPCQVVKRESRSEKASSEADARRPEWPSLKVARRPLL